MARSEICELCGSREEVSELEVPQGVEGVRWSGLYLF
jgi:hypothetical protein